jgi:hypothetical protein
MFLYTLAQMAIIDLVPLDCIQPNLDSDRLSIEGPYESGKSATYIDGLDWRVHKNSEWHKGHSQLILYNI